MALTDVVDAPCGSLRGFLDTHSVSASTTAHLPSGSLHPVKKFLGIPFAQAERWQQSTLLPPWKETRDCLEFGPIPIQPPSKTLALYVGRPGHVERNVTQSEDCLSLNVQAPSRKYDRPLPVLVYIYGGSFTSGHSASAVYDPSDWVRRSEREGKPFIAVTGNHRLSLFGFLAHPDLAAADPIVGNYGLRDNVNLFLWVQRNIAAFGGDTSRITAFGESAGAMQLCALLYSGQRLFNRAILMSGATATMDPKTVAQASPKWNELLEHFKVTGTTAAERVEALRRVPATDLLAYFYPDRMTLGQFNVVLEDASAQGAIWTEDPTVRLVRGDPIDHHIEALIVGCVEEEGTLFTEIHGAVPERFYAMFPEPARKQLDELYPRSDPVWRSDFFGELLFVGPVHHLARTLARRDDGPPVYLYSIRTSPAVLRPGLENLRHTHTFELPLLFNYATMLADHPDDQRAAKALGEAWLDFASGQAPWRRFTPADPAMNVLDAAGRWSLQSADSYKRERLAFWHTVIEHRASQR